MSTVIISAILVVIVTAIIINLVSNKKKGKSSCGGKCSSCCAGCARCKKLAPGLHSTVVEIDGMQCHMCESHINDAIRSAMDVKKIRSSYKQGLCEIISTSLLDDQKLKETIEKAGYTVTRIYH